MPNTLTITRRVTFEYGHRLALHKGPDGIAGSGSCARPHGHSGVAEITLRGSDRNVQRDGMIIDLGIVSKVAGERVRELLDHRTILHAYDPLAFAMYRALSPVKKGQPLDLAMEGISVGQADLENEEDIQRGRFSKIRHALKVTGCVMTDGLTLVPWHPSSENLARFVAYASQDALNSDARTRGASVTHVKFRETENGWAEWHVDPESMNGIGMPPKSDPWPEDP